MIDSYLYPYPIIKCTINADPVNRHSLDAVETAHFTFSLDELAPSTNYDYTSLEDKKEMLERAVHGGGSKKYTCNRWFDTSRQVCIVLAKPLNRMRQGVASNDDIVMMIIHFCQQIVMGGSGWLGTLYEHSHSDGITALAAVMFMHNYVYVTIKKLVFKCGTQILFHCTYQALSNSCQIS